LTAAANGTWSLLQPANTPSLSLGLLGIAAFLLSLGVTADQILGRHAINMLRPEARGRLNGLYTGLMFLGGSLGAFVAGPAFAYGGWSLVCGVATAFSLSALMLSTCERR
jgi:predicted MFS family arabinose efflux permease